MDGMGMACGFFCLICIMVLIGSSSQDIKDKRAIELQQNVFVADCSKQQDPSILDYVERLKACRTAAELKYKMPAYLRRVR